MVKAVSQQHVIYIEWTYENAMAAGKRERERLESWLVETKRVEELRDSRRHFGVDGRQENLNIWNFEQAPLQWSPKIRAANHHREKILEKSADFA